MAVIQISKIQVRRGLQEDLPRLDAGELGWATDTRRLFIGNGVLGSPDYAPEIGNTEILTQLSQGVELAEVRANVANLQSNVSSLQSNVTNILSNISVYSVTLNDNQAVVASTGVTLANLAAASIDYKIQRGITSRVGTIEVTQQGGNVYVSDEYTETASTGVTLTWSGNTVTQTATLNYTTTSTGNDAVLKYYITKFLY